jgi:hypothetical protein
MYFKDLIVAIILIGVMVVLERLARRKQAKTAQKLNEPIKAGSEPNPTKPLLNGTNPAIVKENMKRRLCVAKVIASSLSNNDGGSHTTHCCSIAGNEALIAWIDFPNLMSPRSRFLKHELLDLDTGKRSDIDIGEEGALLTSSYIVTGYAENYIPGVVYCKNKLQIIDRKTKQKREVELKDYPANKFGFMQVNDKKEYDTVAISSNTKFFVVNLRDGSCKTIPMSASFGYQDFMYKMKFQLCGKYLAYSSTELDPQVSPNKFGLEVVNTETGLVCFAEGSDEFNIWSIDDDKILLAAVTQKKSLKWKLIDFSGKVLGRYNLEEPSGASTTHSAAKLNGEIIAISHQSQMFFFDANNAEFLSCVSVLGNTFKSEFSYHQIFAIGVGKFVYLQRFNTRLFDFETSQVGKQIRVPRIFATGEQKYSKAQFGNITAFATKKLKFPPSDLVSLSVRTGDDQKISLIFGNEKATKGLEVNKSAMEYFQKWKPNACLDLLLPEFTENQLITSRPSETNPVTEIRGQVILVRERLKSKWRPIDFDKQ